MGQFLKEDMQHCLTCYECFFSCFVDNLEVLPVEPTLVMKGQVPGKVGTNVVQSEKPVPVAPPSPLGRNHYYLNFTVNQLHTRAKCQRLVATSSSNQASHNVDAEREIQGGIGELSGLTTRCIDKIRAKEYSTNI